ncbi:helix-turn-helix domain-containing protein [Nocardia sp. CA2R105]|uniref:IclR family transcriptional regulator n=1 Tax=Nocardia coffeae TaxID=2873381 RepID=UPI001CA60311|nr:helix-turn-helix domain-containing protein [Nocardia coffeae]MBY8858665.1 helix-turn-helix domain-containing protein [Nocardia coffeae]
MTSTATDRHQATTDEHRTVTRVMSIIEMVVRTEANSVRLADLAASIGAPKSSIHSLAKGLVATGYLREDKARYFIGPAISGLLATGSTERSSAYQHTLTRLTETWGETTILATLVGDTLVYVDVVEPQAVIRASPARHKRQLLWPRSSGKIFLAHMEPRRIDNYLRRHLAEPELEEAARDELRVVRETGIAINSNGYGGLEIGIASPVVFAGSPVTLAVAVAGPDARMRSKMDDLPRSLLAAARALSGRTR